MPFDRNAVGQFNPRLRGTIRGCSPEQIGLNNIELQIQAQVHEPGTREDAAASRCHVAYGSDFEFPQSMERLEGLVNRKTGDILAWWKLSIVLQVPADEFLRRHEQTNMVEEPIPIGV